MRSRTCAALIVLVVPWLFCAQPACAQSDAVPKELQKTFERYSRAWVNRDWGRVYDLTSPAIQKAYNKDFGGRQEWIRHQENDFRDKVTSLDRMLTHQMTGTLFTFQILTKGKRPSGEEFAVKGYASFELIGEGWYLVEPVLPRSAMEAGSAHPGVPTRKKLKGFWEE